MVVTNVGEFGQQLQALRAQVVSASVIGSKLSRNTNNFAMGPWGSSIYSHYNSNSNDKIIVILTFPPLILQSYYGYYIELTYITIIVLVIAMLEITIVLVIIKSITVLICRYVWITHSCHFLRISWRKNSNIYIHTRKPIL